MTDLRNVWVCGWPVMLIRADRIVGLCAVNSQGSLLSGTRLNLAVRSDSWWLAAGIIGGNGEDGMHQVNLLNCDAVQLTAAISGLADALARASERSDAPLYVYPRPKAEHPEEPLWEIGPALPPKWPDN